MMVHLPSSLLDLAHDELWRIIFAKSRSLDLTKRRAAAFDDVFFRSRERWSLRVRMCLSNIWSYDYIFRIGDEDDVVEFPAGSDMWLSKELIISTVVFDDDAVFTWSASKLWSGDDHVSPEAFDDIDEVYDAFEEDGGTTVYMDACEVSLSDL
jgi:hypothetical protein